MSNPITDPIYLRRICTRKINARLTALACFLDDDTREDLTSELYLRVFAAGEAFHAKNRSRVMSGELSPDEFSEIAAKHQRSAIWLATRAVVADYFRQLSGDHDRDQSGRKQTAGIDQQAAGAAFWPLPVPVSIKTANHRQIAMLESMECEPAAPVDTEDNLRDLAKLPSSLFAVACAIAESPTQKAAAERIGMDWRTFRRRRDEIGEFFAPKCR